jgi:hypothetical protein
LVIYAPYRFIKAKVEMRRRAPQTVSAPITFSNFRAWMQVKVWEPQPLLPSTTPELRLHRKLKGKAESCDEDEWETDEDSDAMAFKEAPRCRLEGIQTAD